VFKPGDFGTGQIRGSIPLQHAVLRGPVGGGFRHGPRVLLVGLVGPAEKVAEQHSSEERANGVAVLARQAEGIRGGLPLATGQDERGCEGDQVEPEREPLVRHSNGDAEVVGEDNAASEGVHSLRIPGRPRSVPLGRAWR